MPLFGYILFAAAIVAADQLSKLATTAFLTAQAPVTVIPGLFQLNFVKNTGAAFSSFEGQQWLFALIFLLFTGALVWQYVKKPLPFAPFELGCIAAIWAGGLGNMIDRLRLGYVVDMLQVTFIDFPVFNVADCFITCGCILLMGHLFFLHKDFWKDEKNHDPDC